MLTGGLCWTRDEKAVLDLLTGVLTGGSLDSGCDCFSRRNDRIVVIRGSLDLSVLTLWLIDEFVL